MIIDHTHPLYVKKRNGMVNGNQYNGAYYYSKDIVKHIIPNVKTDRNWVTVRLPEVPIPPHSLVFIHNNRNPNYYSYLKKYDDLILVCSTPNTYENMKFFGNPILLPLSVDVESVKKYQVKNKTKDTAFAGRISKMTNRIPSSAEILSGMSQSKLLREMSKFKKVFCVGRTALQAKILGCELGIYDPMYPDSNFWNVVDCKEAAEMLQQILNCIDSVI